MPWSPYIQSVKLAVMSREAMRTFAIATLFLATPVASAPSCGPSRWILSDGARTFSVFAYGKGEGAGNYTAIALRGRIDQQTYYLINEYFPHATGGPWLSSKILPVFVWKRRPVSLNWKRAAAPDAIDSDIEVFKGPLKGSWRVRGCRRTAAYHRHGNITALSRKSLPFLPQ
jgi:hypothetical protein